MKSYYPKKGRVILHVDMNSFYASVECAYNPLLKGKPLAIAGNVEERKGIIVTCSYEARKFGVKTTMPLWEAKKLCPKLTVMPPNFDRYRKASLELFSILNEFSPLVEPISIDEGYVDITDSYDSGSPIHIAETIQKSILERLDLPCSIGIAPNKFLAKMASDLKKPMGITVLRKRDVPAILWPMEVEEMHGIGKKTGEKLRAIGITTIKDLAMGDSVQLKAVLGINGKRLKERANGEDKRMVDPEAANEFKSIGNSTTLPKDIANQQELFSILDSLAFKVATRMKIKHVHTLAIAVTIRYENRKNNSKSMKLINPIKTQSEIFEMSKQLFLKAWSGDAVRLLGVTATELVDNNIVAKQLDLFSYEKEAEKEPLLKTISALKEKYGASIIENAGDRSDWKEEENIGTSTSFNKDFLQRKKFF
ncbi:DNA polymerase IV [Niallia sp. NCCP-28]|uniref:DNA polymerase IV n=1 Tax=Niallia sp. NCCP-28 TaxID=2934712 RepID=UPI00208879D2|nr:DNA polymerase IV [Niallia sp. NCCP-28]GKU81103.1 DNA polymerase IV 1 [Niallia sp. NCCP-28]